MQQWGTLLVYNSISSGQKGSFYRYIRSLYSQASPAQTQLLSKTSQMCDFFYFTLNSFKVWKITELPTKQKSRHLTNNLSP